MGLPRTRQHCQVLEDIKMEELWQEIEKKRLWEDRRDWRLFIHQKYKMEMMLEE
jgi:hypothetical protein